MDAALYIELCAASMGAVWRRDGSWRLRLELSAILCTLDGKVTRCLNPQPNVTAFDAHNGDADLITDENTLSEFTRQNQHRQFLAVLLHER